MTKQLPSWVSLILILPFVISSCSKPAELELAAIISDGMVLRQNAQNTFWGRAVPGTNIKITTDWDFSTSTSARPDSTWSVNIGAPAADGKQHTIVFATRDITVTVSNVVLGEVWLAAGQSNMEMPLGGWANDSIYQSAKAISEANNDNIRFFDVEKKFALKDQFCQTGKWQISTPETAKSFSAAAYFFAKHLSDSLQMPVGIIEADYGNTTCEAWTSPDALANDEVYGEVVKNIGHVAEQIDEYNRTLNSLPSIPFRTDVDDPIAHLASGGEYITQQPHADISSWDTMTLPRYWNGTDLNDLDGIVWFVKTVKIPQKWVGKNLTLSLGNIDDRDMAFVNGMIIGSHNKPNMYNIHRIYTIPNTSVVNTSLTIAIRVTDECACGGFGGAPEDMYIKGPGKDTIGIAGEWKYCVAGEIVDRKLVLFDVATNYYKQIPKPAMRLNGYSPSTLYFGMISSIANYAISGIIWYQGEANMGHARQYEKLMKSMVSSFRNTFGNKELPFICTQIAPWSYGETDSCVAANLREAQRRAANSLTNCCLISTLDIGSPDTQHPCRKDLVGERYARAALHYAYGRKDIVPRGPEIHSSTRIGSLLVLTFMHAHGLRINFNAQNQFEVAGIDGTFYEATSLVRDTTVTVFSHAVPDPEYVRYGYRNYVEATLFNGDALPAPSFSTMPTIND